MARTDLPPVIQGDGYLGPAEFIEAQAKRIKQLKEALAWIINNVLNESQLDTRLKCGQTIRNYQKELLDK